MNALPVWLTGVLLVVVLPALVVAAQIGLRRVWPALREGDHNEVAGFIIAVVGVIYAVLLGFVVIVSWENFAEAEDVVGTGGQRAAHDVPRQRRLPAAGARADPHADVRDYAAAAVEDEWPAMARGEPGSPEVARVLDETVRAAGRRSSPRPPDELQYKGIEADRFNDLVTAGRPGWTSSTRACPRCSGWR